MQTFLPYADFERTARVLDPKRLGKQRVECIQVLRGLTVEGYGWRHHPAVRMWRGHEEALGRYAFTCCEVWLEAGFGDTCAATIGQELATIGIEQVRTQAELADAGRFRRGSATTTSTAVTSRRSSARTRSATARCSPACPTTSPTSGRQRTDPRELDA